MRPAPVSGTAGDDRYQLLSEHGRGGLGRVVRAHDRYLGRTVAVKELLRTSELAERLFLREAMITARLEHPGIVPVHEAGRWPNGDPFYVMKLVSGRTLKEVITDARTLGDRLALLPHLIAVADAVGYAHSEGVVHRDLKPTNVMIGEFGETVVIDWGLARDLRAPDGSALDAPPSSPGDTTPAPTVTGRVIGTPQYMAPEQARGEAVGTTADVYALGAMLYELLAGRPPIEGDSVQQLLDQVRSGPPSPVGRAVGGVPADLEAIVGKAMARGPEDRYPTARELAADLKRFQTGQLVTAQRYGRWRLLRRWLVRHRAYVGTAAMALVAIGVVAAGMLRSVFDDRRHAQQQRAQAWAEREHALADEAKLILAQARASLSTDPTTALAWLKEYKLTPDSASAIRELADEAEAAGVAAQAWKLDSDARNLVLSPDGAWVAEATDDGHVLVRDTATGASRHLGDGRAGIAAIAPTPDSRTLYVGTVDGRVGRLDVRGPDGSPPQEVGHVDGPITGVSVVADGTLVVRTATEVWRQDHASGPLVELFTGSTPIERLALAGDDRRADVTIAHGADGKIRLWRGTSGPTVVATVPGMPARLAVTADGKRAVIATTSALHLLDLATGEVRHMTDLHDEVNRITIDPTQRRAAVVTKGPDVYLIDLAAGTLEVKRGHTDGVYTAAFDARGDRMVTASDDGTVRIWDLPTGDVRELRGHRDDVVSAEISDDGHTVLSSSVDETMRVWRIEDRRTTVVGHLDDVRQIAPLGGERVRVLSAGKGVQIVDVDLATRQTTVQLADPDAVAVRSRMFYGGQSAILMHGPQDAVQWRGGQTRALHLPPTAKYYSVTRSGRVFGVDLDGTVWRQDGGVTTTIAHAAAGATVVADYDGDTAIVQDRTAFRVIDATTGAERAQITRKQLGVSGAAGAGYLHGDGRILIGGMTDLETAPLRLWDPTTGEVISLPESEHSPRELVMSPDRRWLVGGVEKRALRIWDARTGAVQQTLTGHRDGVFSMEFSPDSRRLASASYDRTVRVWDLATGESRVLSGHVGPVWGVTWIGGDHVASAGGDGTVRLWAVPPMPPPDLAQLSQRLKDLTAVTIDGDASPDARTASAPALALSPQA
ncbi:MAG TPA: protein kinase [Kofleriaceae bacterium]|nr:protein kinase [Kofleriaceae bacterium]